MSRVPWITSILSAIRLSPRGSRNIRASLLDCQGEGLFGRRALATKSFVRIKVPPNMRRRYQKWMVDWETRLTMRDTNRVVRPFEWGLEWTKGWPGVNGHPPSPDHDSMERFFHDLNHHIVTHSDEFFSYRTPT